MPKKLLSAFGRKQATSKYLPTSHICMPKYEKEKHIPNQLLKHLQFWCFFFLNQLILLDITWYYNLVNEIFQINKNKYCIYISRLPVSVMN